MAAKSRYLSFSSGRLTFWQVATGQELLGLPARRYPVMALAIAPNGRVMASGGGCRDENDGINVWFARPP